MISNADPPELQIRILFVEVLPAGTLPKSMIKLGSHPPSLVDMEMLAIGAVLPLPTKRTYSFPPLDQMLRKLWNWPVVLVKKLSGTVTETPGSSVEPTAGKSDEVKAPASPMTDTGALFKVACVILV